MLKKKKELDINKILLNINKLTHIHDCTFVKSCDKKGNIISITSIDNIEYKSDESLIYLERKINDTPEILTAFTRDSIKDIKYITESKDDSDALLVTITA